MVDRSIAGKNPCYNCQFHRKSVSGRMDLLRCARPGRRWDWAGVERMRSWFDKWIIFYGRKHCGQEGRWFKQITENTRHGGHRVTPQASPSGPTNGAGTRGTGACPIQVTQIAATGTDPNPITISSSVSYPVMGSSGLHQTGLGLAQYARPGTVQVTSSSIHPYYNPVPKPEGMEVGEIIAWRVWRLKRGFLQSVHRSDVWPTEEAMHGDIGYMGIHAFKSEALALEYGWNGENSAQHVYIVGKVALWGDVIEHERGYRAEWARPYSFSYCLGGPTASHKDIIAAMTEKYLTRIQGPDYAE